MSGSTSPRRVIKYRRSRVPQQLALQDRQAVANDALIRAKAPTQQETRGCEWPPPNSCLETTARPGKWRNHPCVPPIHSFGTPKAALSSPWFDTVHGSAHLRTIPRSLASCAFLHVRICSPTNLTPRSFVPLENYSARPEHRFERVREHLYVCVVFQS